MDEKILFVDDETYVLESLKRELGFDFEIDTANSGAEGLQKIQESGPYAVVVADYRMPQMNGVQFLVKVMEAAPDTVRMMLTGNADLDTAIHAVNNGQVFRFLTKPCEHDLMARSLKEALRQYQLVVAEKELLEKTLVESINMLTEILSIVSPKAYGKALRVRQLVSYVGKQLQLQGAWQYEMAAALSQLGWIIFPPHLLDKLETYRPLSATDNLTFAKHPFVASKLIGRIPRLDLIGRIIEGQERSIGDLCLDPTAGDRYFVDLGSHLLKVCVDYDALLARGNSHQAVMTEMYANQRFYYPEFLKTLSTLRSYQPEQTLHKVALVRVEDLETGMVVVEPIRDINGNVLVSKGVLVTRSIIVQLYSLSHQPGYIVEPLKVVNPKR